MAFRDFLTQARSPAVISEITKLLEAGDVEGAMAIIDRYIVRMGQTAIPAVFQNAAQAEVAAAGGSIPGLSPTVALVFDPTDAAAAQLMRAATLEFIREFTDAQRDATRAALAEALSRGSGTQATALAFRDSIGLTKHQLAIVENYRALLQAGSSDALDRALRDRRFDGSVRRAVKGEPIPKETIDKMVDRYRARMLAKRAEDIARTETLGVVEQGRETAFRQTMEAAGLTEADVDQTWRSTKDKRTRHSHRELNGQVRQMGQPFETAEGIKLRWPGDRAAPIKEVINCRCVRTFAVKATPAPAAIPAPAA